MAESGAIVGALRVIIGADSAALEKGLKDAQSSLGSFASGLGKFGAAAAAAMAGIGLAVGVAVRGAIKEADELGKTAQKIGDSVENFSALKYAADLSDVSIDTLTTSMTKLAKNLNQIAQGEITDTGQALKALGINVRNNDGSLKTSTQVISDVAAKFATYKDSVEKTALAQAIFGKSGAQMIPLLNEGRTGIQEMTDEALRFGVVVSGETAKAADEFNDNLTRMNAIKNGIVLTVTSRMLPAFQSLTQMLLNASQNADLMKSSSEGLANALKGLITVVVGVVTGLTALSTILAGVFAAAVLAAQGQFSAAAEALKQSFSDMKSQVTTGVDVIKDVWNEAGIAAKQSAEEQKKATAPVFQSVEAVKKAASEAEAAYKKLAAAGKRTYEETRTPLEQYSDKIRDLNAQLKAGVISADTYARAVNKAAYEMAQANPATKIFESSISSAFDKVLDGQANLHTLIDLLRDVAKAFAQAALKALLFGQSNGLGGAGLLGGLINSSGSLFTGFATGGSFTVRGSGGVDSQLVAFKATPGEQVDVRTPGQMRDTSGPASAAPVHVDARQKIVNAFDSVSFLSEALSSSQGEKVLLNFVRANPGAFRAAMSG